MEQLTAQLRLYVLELVFEQVGDGDVGLPDGFLVPLEGGLAQVDHRVTRREVAQHALLPCVDMRVDFVQQVVQVLLVLCVVVYHVGSLL